MHKFSFYFIILFAGCHIDTTLALESNVFLKPDLMVQMKKQEVVNKETIYTLRKLSNAEKLRLLRANKKTGVVTIERTTLKQKIQANTQVTHTASIVRTPTLTPIITPGVTDIADVDMNRVRTEWLSWYNTARSELGLNVYSYDSRLDTTAHTWNVEFARGKGQNHHRRHPSDSYYDYTKITDWFANQGVVAKVVGGATTTENVGYGYYRCTSSDCTNSLVASIRTTFEFFMSEKGKQNDAHYRSIISKSFSKIGLDIIVVPEENRYYLTVHYMTE